jgi:hypothetical protein
MAGGAYAVLARFVSFSKNRKITFSGLALAQAGFHACAST